MAEIQVTCECGRRLHFKPDYIGRRAHCPECLAEWTVPDREQAQRLAWNAPPGTSPPQLSQKAVTSVTLGVLSFCFFFITSIPAILFGIVALAQIAQSQGRLYGRRIAVLGIGTGMAGTFFGVLVFLIPAFTQLKQRSDRAGCVGNLRHVGAAMIRYHKNQGHFPPPAIVDNQGQALLSWRVDLLREIDLGLYREFHLDEPWDSPHNIKLLPRMPAIYACPIDAAKRPGMTHFQVVVGPGKPGPCTAFEEGRGVTIDEFKDGPSATLLVAEAAQSVPWTRPHDLRFEPAPWLPPPNSDQRDTDVFSPLPQFSSRHARSFNILRADGSAGPFRARNRGNAIRAMLTRDGLENVGGG